MRRRRGALAAHAAGVVVLGAAAVCVFVASRGGAVRASAVLSAARGADSKHPRGELAEGVRAEPAASARATLGHVVHATYADDAAGLGSRRSRSATGRAHSVALDAEEAAVEGRPQLIDRGVPQAELRDEQAVERQAGGGAATQEAAQHQVASAPRGVRDNHRAAEQQQGDISVLDRLVGNADRAFRNYERGNPYWDKRAIFALEPEDGADSDDVANDDADADADAAADSKRRGSAIQGSDADSEHAPGGHAAAPRTQSSGRGSTMPKEDIIIRWERSLQRQAGRLQRIFGDAARSRSGGEEMGARGSTRHARVARMQSDAADADFLER